MLASVTIKFKDKKLAEVMSNKDYIKLIGEELNVEKVNLTTGAKEYEFEVGLDTKITPELKKKGMYRELVRRINALRKAAGLTIGDSIAVYFETKDEMVSQVFDEFDKHLKNDTLAEEIASGKKDVEHFDEFKADGKGVWIGIEKK